MRGLAVVVVLCACGGKELGETCAESSECGGALACLSVADEINGACVQLTRVCSVTCTADAVCAELERGWLCHAGCLGDTCFGP